MNIVKVTWVWKGDDGRRPEVKQVLSLNLFTITLKIIPEQSMQL